MIPFDDESFKAKLDMLRLAFIMRKPEARLHAQDMQDELEYGLRRDAHDRVLALARARELRTDALLLSEYADSAAVVSGMLQEAYSIERWHGMDTIIPHEVSSLRARLEAVKALLAEFAKANLHIDMNLYNWTDRGPGNMVMARATDLGPTPEAWAQSLKASRIAPIPELFANGHIDKRHVAAAREIAWVVEGVTAKLDARAGGYNPSGGTAPAWSNEVPFQVAEAHAKRYLPWSRDMQALQQVGQRHFDLTMAVVVGGVSMLAARRQYHLGYGTAVKLIKDSLKDYWDRIRADRRKEDEAKRANMHAASS